MFFLCSYIVYDHKKLCLCLISLLHVISTEVSGEKNPPQNTRVSRCANCIKFIPQQFLFVHAQVRSTGEASPYLMSDIVWSLEGFCMAFYNLQCDKEISCSSRPPIEPYCSGFRELTVSDSPQKTHCYCYSTSDPFN